MLKEKARAGDTVSVKLWVAMGATPLLAVKIRWKVPATVGVPLSSPAAVKVTPVGNGVRLLRLKVGFGNPLAVMLNDPAEPTINAALLGLVMAGACFTVRVKVWVALPMTLLAEKT